MDIVVEKKTIIDDTPISDIYPKEWKDSLNLGNTYIAEYRNLQHFKHHIQNVSQKQDSNCGVNYAEALADILQNKSTMTKGDYEIIKNKVKENLLKRGLIADTVYESYKYAVEGNIWDVAKVISEDPMCCLVPNETYTNYFYELYVSVSYPHYVSNETIMENMAKILATVELLEREHYYCKITLVMPNQGCNRGEGKSNYLALIPLFAHKDVKTIEYMSAVLNDRLLRKFFFAIWEDQYGSNLDSGYGCAIELPNTIRPVDLCEVELATAILDKVITPCKSR